MTVLGDNGVLRLKRTTDTDYLFLCDIEQWDFNVDAPSIDTTPLGTQFREAIKDIITGNGSIAFYFEWKNNVIDPKAMLDLVMLTKTGSQAEAQLYLVDNREEYPCDNQAGGTLYYQANILITRSSISTRRADITRGVINFVTTEEIQLVVN